VDSGVTAPGAPVDGVPVALRCADFVSLVAGLPPARVPSS